jgi:flagellum-specific peptidoglycan hydrolase FlgJ
MWTTLAAILVPIIKYIFEKIAKKQLDDKQFAEYISAYQKRRSKAGDTAMNWETALEEARKELGQTQVKKTNEVSGTAKPVTPPAIVGKPLIKNLATAYRNRIIEAPALKAVTLAQWMLESGRGTSELCTLYSNFAGLKWRTDMRHYPGISPQRYEAHDGSEVYCRFDNMENFITGYWGFINRDAYKGWREYAKDPKGFLEHIVKCGYCPDKDYVEKILKILPEAQELLK